ncbi:hypothetical protein [Leucobacter sp. W1478]|uniref:hypothetical protein n=1 Tax=Leucobacter sp. W1478 TaxID=3439065 RepID=UPI003F3760C9
MSQQDALGGIAGLDAQRSYELRGHRPAVIEAADRALEALFDVAEGDEAPGLTRSLRLLAAARAAIVDGAAELGAFYLEQVEEEPGSAGLHAHAYQLLAHGGSDSEAGLTASRRARALLRHTDLLVQRPAASTADDLTSLQAAGYSVQEIVVLAQVVTFVTYQARVLHGLRILEEASR